MTPKSQERLEYTKGLRLPELQKAFVDIVGETTRAPNKTYLLRRIQEALEAQDAANAEATSFQGGAGAVSVDHTCEAQKENGSQRIDYTSAPQETEKLVSLNQSWRAVGGARSESSHVLPKLTKMSVSELRAQYVYEIGRETGSYNRGYLIWKIRQARNGHITIGPLEGKQAIAQNNEHQTIPIRMRQATVARLDAARKRLKLKSRHELIRRALAEYLHVREEGDLAYELCPNRLDVVEDVAPTGGVFVASSYLDVVRSRATV